MTPASFTEKAPVFTAAAWDGSEESATWILAEVPGASRNGDAITVRDSLDREAELPAGSWVVRDENSGVVNQMTHDEFTARFEPAEA